MQNGGYNYIYGLDFNSSTNAFSGMKVAETPGGVPETPPGPWSGVQWVVVTNAIAAATPTELTGVIALANDSGYMSVSMPADCRLDRRPDILVLADGAMELRHAGL